MPRNINHQYASLVGTVRQGPAIGNDIGKAYSSVRLEVHNSLRRRIFWRNALGLVVTEQPNPSNMVDECVYIKIEYEFDAGTRVDARELLDELDLPPNHAERKAIMDALHNLETQPHWRNQRHFGYTLSVTREQLDRSGGVVYLNDLDIIIGYEEHRDTLHPYSPPGQRDGVNKTLPDVEGFIQQVVIVDNSGIHGNRWINTGQGVHEIHSITNSQLRDGVYVTSRLSREKEPETITYVLEEADEKLGLYRTRAEAETFGSPDQRFASELKTIEQELARDKVELQRAKQDSDRQKMDLENERRRQEELAKDEELRRQRHKEEMERERERLKMERERIEFERATYSERRKFEYENESRDRKDRSDQYKAIMDVVKVSITLVSLGLSLALLIKKGK